MSDIAKECLLATIPAVVVFIALGYLFGEPPKEIFIRCYYYSAGVAVIPLFRWLGWKYPR